MSKYAIEAEGLGKRYRLYPRPHRRVLEALSFGRWPGHRELWALRDLSFRVPRGSVLGVCGQNGAGKSTLLRILCGTTFPSEGRYRVNGRVNGMLDLAAGIQHDASGRANIRYQGMLLGWKRSAIQQKTDEIIEFSELGDFIDDPLRTYSAGMAMRLAFSVAALMDPDVLILDEVFAVGDVAFQKRCIDRIQSFKSANKTILFCGHSMYDIRQLCDHAIWLRDGRLAAEGEVVSVTGQYTSYMREREDLPSTGTRSAGDAPAADQPHVVDGHMYLLDAPETAPPGARQSLEITTGDSLAVHVDWKNPPNDGRPLHLGIGVVREDGTVCIGLGSSMDRVALNGPAGSAVLRLPKLQLLSGNYLVLVWLLDETGAHRFHEFILDHKLIVTASTKQLGVFVPEHEWEVLPQ